MKAKPAELDQNTKAFYDSFVKEAVKVHQSATGVIGLISEIANSTISDDSNAKRLAAIRYIVTAYDQALDAQLAQLREARQA